MTNITASELIADIRRILSDETATYKWSDATVVANINMALRAVLRDAPVAAFTTVVAFNETVELVGTGTEGALAGTETIAMDVRWQDAVAHYACHLCFLQTTRDTVNAEYAARELKRYEEAL